MVVADLGLGLGVCFPAGVGVSCVKKLNINIMHNI